MKKSITAVFMLLTAIMILCACNNEDVTEQTGAQTESTEAAQTETTSEPEDPFSAVRESGEEWLKYGLSAYESGKEPSNLKAFFAEASNISYLTLYDHMFTFDEEKSVPAAEALFCFILDEYGIEALLDIDKRIEYKTAFLKSLGLDIEYTQPAEIEALLVSMDFSSNKNYKYIISFDSITYYFKDFGSGTPSQYHGFLFYNTRGLNKMVEYINENVPGGIFDTERNYDFYMTFDGSGYSKTITATGNMYINDSNSGLHEAVHAMGIVTYDNIWLSEGICNYFGKALGFNDQIALSYMQILSMAKMGYFDERAKAGDEHAIMSKSVYEKYSERGGKLDSVDSFDLRLYYDIAAGIELETGNYVTLGQAYKAANKKECNSVGEELSYDQTTSLMMYLVDNYGIEKLLEAYKSQNISMIFGKDYEALKAEWLEYLK